MNQDTTSQPSDELEQLLQATKGSVFLYGDNMDAGQIRDFVKKLKAALLAREKRLTVAARIEMLDWVNDIIYDQDNLVFKTNVGTLRDHMTDKYLELQAELDKL